jgi:hypothetical protein
MRVLSSKIYKKKFKRLNIEYDPNIAITRLKNILPTPNFIAYHRRKNCSKFATEKCFSKDDFKTHPLL